MRNEFPDFQRSPEALLSFYYKTCLLWPGKLLLLHEFRKFFAMDSWFRIIIAHFLLLYLAKRILWTIKIRKSVKSMPSVEQVFAHLIISPNFQMEVRGAITDLFRTQLRTLVPAIWRNVMIVPFSFLASWQQVPSSNCKFAEPYRSSSAVVLLVTLGFVIVDRWVSCLPWIRLDK